MSSCSDIPTYSLYHSPELCAQFCYWSPLITNTGDRLSSSILGHLFSNDYNYHCSTAPAMRSTDTKQVVGSSGCELRDQQNWWIKLGITY